MFVIVCFDYSSESGKRESSIVGCGYTESGIESTIQKLFNSIKENDCDGLYDDSNLEQIEDCNMRHAFDKYRNYEYIWSVYELEADDEEWNCMSQEADPIASWGVVNQ